jgi:hypothetical protein
LKRGGLLSRKQKEGNPLQTFLTFNGTSLSRIFEARKTTLVAERYMRRAREDEPKNVKSLISTYATGQVQPVERAL